MVFKKIKAKIAKLFYSFEYYVLFKESSIFDPLSNDFLYGFTKLPNSFRYWTADPFAFKYNDCNYIFCELGNRFSWKGKIAFYKIGTRKKWKVCIKEKWHLSFPNIFFHNGELIMMCETYERQSIYFYKCVNFPKKWEKLETPFINGLFVDSDFFQYDGSDYLITYSISDNINKLMVFEYSEKSFVLIQEIVDYKKQLRAAGKVFKVGKTMYYPSQDCSQSYGRGIVINELRFDDEKFSFHPVKSLSTKEFMKIYKTPTIHFHTINHSEDLIVLDASKPCKSFYVFYKRIIRFVLALFARGKKDD